MTLTTGPWAPSTTARPGAMSTAEIKARIAAMFDDTDTDTEDSGRPGPHPRTKR
jgi:hypothetical protein